MMSSLGVPEILIILGICLCALLIIAAVFVVVVLIAKKNRKQPTPVSKGPEVL